MDSPVPKVVIAKLQAPEWRIHALGAERKALSAEEARAEAQAAEQMAAEREALRAAEWARRAARAAAIARPWGWCCAAGERRARREAAEAVQRSAEAEARAAVAARFVAEVDARSVVRPRMAAARRFAVQAECRAAAEAVYKADAERHARVEERRARRALRAAQEAEGECALATACAYLAKRKAQGARRGAKERYRSAVSAAARRTAKEEARASAQVANEAPLEETEKARASAEPISGGSLVTARFEALFAAGKRMEAELRALRAEFEKTKAAAEVGRDAICVTAGLAAVESPLVAARAHGSPAFQPEVVLPPESVAESKCEVKCVAAPGEGPASSVAVGKEEAGLWPAAPFWVPFGEEPRLREAVRGFHESGGAAASASESSPALSAPAPGQERLRLAEPKGSPHGPSPSSPAREPCPLPARQLPRRRRRPPWRSVPSPPWLARSEQL
jgi:hypothetical protein